MARKSLGQHFLSDPGILRRIADALPAPAGDTVLEIGPGHGALTRELLARGYRVVAIERDRDLVPELARRFPSLNLVEGDALDVDWPAVAGVGPGTHWWVIGNIPYNITSPLIDVALNQATPPSTIVYLVQKEVAVRLAAGPGSKDYGALTVGAQAAATVERLFTVPAGAFRPVPKVDSAVVRLTPHAAGRPLAEIAAFRRFVVGLFGARRKQLVRAMRVTLDLDTAAAAATIAAAGLDLTQRPETLSVGDFERLFSAVLTAGPPRL